MVYYIYNAFHEIMNSKHIKAKVFNFYRLHIKLYAKHVFIINNLCVNANI